MPQKPSSESVSSDAKPAPSPAPAIETPVTNASTSADTPKIDSKTEIETGIKPEIKKGGYTNPAFKAMGLPPLRLPSRNWSIFWVVVGGLVGGAFYDHQKHKSIRAKYMAQVTKYGDEPIKPNVEPRKIRVFIAPPPNDYLDESLKVFRRYIKPVLNAGGVDFEVKSENRQGVIRSSIAAEIRALRREILENEAHLKELENQRKWYNKMKSWFTKPQPHTVQEEELRNKKASDEFDLKNVIGIFYNNPHKYDQMINEDVFNDELLNGGIICIGRGAYKEYLAGIHEGLLGPLEKPLDHKELKDWKGKKAEAVKTAGVDQTDKESAVESRISDEDEAVSEVSSDVGGSKLGGELKEDNSQRAEDEKKDENSKNEETANSEDQDQDSKKDEYPVPKPFIEPDQYPTCKLPEELEHGRKPVPFYQQPILVIPNYHLLGFLHIPERIYRFYTRSQLTERYGKATVALVENLQRPFGPGDIDLAKDEEHDWPSKWVKSGEEKGSEWTRKVVVDERVVSKLRVYDPSQVKEHE